MNDRAYRRAISRAFGKVQKRINKMPAKCFYPECSLSAVDSHSQQKLGQLREIAENGQVYSMQRNHYQFQKNLPDAPLFVKTGISEASTFKGFCAKHDRSVFDVIELTSLKTLSAEQAFALFLRAVSYEFAQKRRMLQWSNLLLEEIGELVDDKMLGHFEAMRDGKAAFFKQDAPYYMNFVFGTLENKDYSQLTTVWKVVDQNLGISSCSVFSPLLEKHQDYMRETWGRPQPLVTFNLVPSPASTHVVSSWLPNCHSHCGWIMSEVSSPDGLELFINRCAFAESEDTCIRPSLWESMPEAARRTVEMVVMPEHVRGQLPEVPRIVRP
jgi:hypothetical protein